MKDKNQTCAAHFRGIDGLGTCDTECQWYCKDCPNSSQNVHNANLGGKDD